MKHFHQTVRNPCSNVFKKIICRTHIGIQYNPVSNSVTIWRDFTDVRTQNAAWDSLPAGNRTENFIGRSNWCCGATSDTVPDTEPCPNEICEPDSDIKVCDLAFWNQFNENDAQTFVENNFRSVRCTVLATQSPTTTAPVPLAGRVEFDVRATFRNFDYSAASQEEQGAFRSQYMRVWANHLGPTVEASHVTMVLRNTTSPPGGTIVDTVIRMDPSLQDQLKVDSAVIFSTRLGFDVASYGVPQLSTNEVDSPSGDDESLDDGEIAGIVVAAVAFVFTLLTVIWYCRLKDRRAKEKKRKEEEQKDNDPGPSTRYFGKIKVYAEKDVEILEILGEGNFGTARKAKILRPKKEIAVIKMSKDGNKGIAEGDLRELLAMANMKPHPNLLKLFGVVTVHERPCFLVEYCEKGSLNNLHKTIDMIQPSTFLRIARDICSGLQCLHGLRIVHRDLACRNLLMRANGTVVVADYGLSRKLKNDNDVYLMRDSRFPWAWTAPEAICTYKYTVKSDMWSLGVTFWEIATRGKQPYLDQMRQGKRNVIKKITEGTLTLEIPQLVLDRNLFLASVITRCLVPDPDTRPTATDVLKLIHAEMKDNNDEKSLEHKQQPGLTDQEKKQAETSTIQQSETTEAGSSKTPYTSVHTALDYRESAVELSRVQPEVIVAATQDYSRAKLESILRPSSAQDSIPAMYRNRDAGYTSSIGSRGAISLQRGRETESGDRLPASMQADVLDV
uniref:Protein kinase domain-containing protein n=1 Tax=Lotharella globosa TaxID=91324 RepID=A0A7S4DNA7_9EUKA